MRVAEDGEAGHGRELDFTLNEAGRPGRVNCRADSDLMSISGAMQLGTDLGGG